MQSVASPASRSGHASAPARWSLSEVALALLGLVLFQALTLTSGQIAVGDGLGWDGQQYALLMTDGLDQGSVVPRSRPLLPLLTRIPYALGLGVIESFQLMNVVYAFALYFFAARIINLYDTRMRVKAVVIGNLALCIATSKMFAYYPVQVDLGALALLTAACYFVLTDRHWLAGFVCILALASREFGIAILLAGLHRTFRKGRIWPDGLAYLPGVLTVILIRRMTYAEGGLTVNDALANLELWLSAEFVAAFVYFVVTVFGGVSAILVLHPRWCFTRLRQEPELATFLIVIVGLTAAGSLDIWRYLAFLLPVVVALAAQYYRGRVHSPALERSIAAGITFVTVFTQRPFGQMDTALYFRDWFPLYNIIGQTPSPDFLALWATRFGALVLLVIVLASVARSNPGLPDSAS